MVFRTYCLVIGKDNIPCQECKGHYCIPTYSRDVDELYYRCVDGYVGSAESFQNFKEHTNFEKTTLLGWRTFVESTGKDV